MTPSATFTSAGRVRAARRPTPRNPIPAARPQRYASSVQSDPPRSAPPSTAPDGIERRSRDRIEVEWAVDCQSSDTFLYASISNISELGIFVRTNTPLAVGTRLTLRFEAPGIGAFALFGQVAWVNPVRALGENPNPGMGVRFLELDAENRRRLVTLVHTFAYVRDHSS